MFRPHVATATVAKSLLTNPKPGLAGSSLHVKLFEIAHGGTSLRVRFLRKSFMIWSLELMRHLVQRFQIGHHVDGLLLGEKIQETLGHQRKGPGLLGDDLTGGNRH